MSEENRDIKDIKSVSNIYSRLSVCPVSFDYSLHVTKLDLYLHSLL